MLGEYTKKVLVSLSFFFISACATTVNNTTADTPEHAASNAKTSLADTNIQLGFDYLDEDNTQQAKQKLLTALDVAPDYPPAWYAMAYYLEVTGDVKKANDYYLKAIALAPKDGDAQNNYGTFLCHTGKAKESIQHFLLATQDPEYIDVAGAYENAGLCALLIPDKKLALQYFNKAFLQDPRGTDTLINLAELNYQQKNYQASKTYLQYFLNITQPTPRSQQLMAKLANVGVLATADVKVE